MNGRQKGSFSRQIDIEIIGGLERVAQKRGESVAHIAEVAFTQFLSTDVELTSLERANYKKIGIELALDSLGSVLNVPLKGDILTKTYTIMAICSGFDNIFPLRESTKIAKLSLFEILTDIRDYDKGLFEEILPQLKRFRKLHDMFRQTTF